MLASQAPSENARRVQQRRSRTASDSVKRRGERVFCLAQLGELSSARQVLEGEPVASGDNHTLRSPGSFEETPSARDPLPDDALLHQLEVPFSLEQDRLLRNLRVSRRGSAAGPSGMIADHLRPLLDSVHDSELFWRFCEGFARATLPDEIVRVVKMGRETALQKPSGGVRVWSATS